MSINPRLGTPLLEILRRARFISEATAGVTYEQYAADPQLQALVERHLEVIGEAFRRISDADEATADRLETAQGFIGLRNVIAHGYDRLVHQRIWDVVTGSLPSTIDQVSSLLEELGEPR